MTRWLLAEIWRWAQLIIGWLLLVLGPLIGGPFPGPFGIIGFVAGLILVLRNSRWARRRFIRLKRRYPQTLGHVRHTLKHGVNWRGMIERLRNRPGRARRSSTPDRRPARPAGRSKKSDSHPQPAPVESGKF